MLTNHNCKQAFQDYVDQCVGVDISESMVEAFNAKAKSQVRDKTHPLFPHVPQSYRPN